MPIPTEAEVLKNTLKSTSQGGSVVDSTGVLGAGANVPNVLSSNPALRQLLEESVAIQSGKNGRTPSPVVTSEDVQTEYDTNKSALDERINQMKPGDSKLEDQPQIVPDGVTKEHRFNEETGRVESGADPVADSLNKWEADRKAEFDKQAEQQKAQYETLYSTSLAAMDATTAATIDNIKNSYDKRIGEQRRINDINIARVKAYGLGGGGIYTPIDFSDAVSAREVEASNKISELEAQRNSLIAAAKAAADSGRVDLLRNKMADLSKIEQQMNENLLKVQEEANKQYEVLQKYRTKAEQDHKDKLAEAKTRFALIASTYLEQYDGKDQAAKDALIKQIMSQTGLDYASIFGEMEKAASNAQILKSKEAKGELRTVDGQLYQITYDKAGKPISTLVQGKAPKAPSGPSSQKQILSSTDKKKMSARGLDPNDQSDVADYLKAEYGDDDGGEPVLSLAEFEKLAAEQLDEAGNPIYNQSGDELKAKYDEYVSQAQGQKITKTLTATDKKKMYSQGLDPENAEDVKKYIDTAYQKKSSVPGPTVKKTQ